jgi:hypothetical protein
MTLTLLNTARAYLPHDTHTTVMAARRHGLCISLVTWYNWYHHRLSVMHGSAFILLRKEVAFATHVQLPSVHQRQIAHVPR